MISRSINGRRSPIHSSLKTLTGEWGQVNQMPVLTSAESADGSSLQLCDLSCLTRFGLKGAGAANWLSQQEIPVPERPNSWQILENGLIARLGLSEFLLEDGFNGRLVDLAETIEQTRPAQVYPVLRQDLALAVWGEAVFDLFAQTCNINFRAQPAQAVILTSMIGVSVTVLSVGPSHYRIWCDGTYGEYVWQTLLEIARELGGDAVGINQFNQLTSNRELSQ